MAEITSRSEMVDRTIRLIGGTAITLMALMNEWAFVLFIAALTGRIAHETFKSVGADWGSRWSAIGCLAYMQFVFLWLGTGIVEAGIFAISTCYIVAHLLHERMKPKIIFFVMANATLAFWILYGLGRFYLEGVLSPVRVREDIGLFLLFLLHAFCLWVGWIFFSIMTGSAFSEEKSQTRAVIWFGLLFSEGTFYALWTIEQFFSDVRMDMLSNGIRYAGGRFRIFGLFLIVWLTDTGAFLVGRALGGRKLAPRLSPGKTWSGFWGGIAVASIVCTTAAVLSPHPLFPATTDATPWYEILILTAILSVAAHAGDLIESAAKRYLGVKDMGTTIPGHGGLADRFDSLLLVSFVAFVISWGVRSLA